MAINYRTHFAYRIDLWDADGENVIEHLAGVEDPQVAMATYVAACQRWPKAHLAPRLSSNRRQSPDSACVSATRTRRAFSFGGHGPMTSLESLGAFAAMIFIAALTVATAFPVTAQS